MNKTVYIPTYIHWDDFEHSGECYLNKEKAEQAVELQNSKEHPMNRHWSVQTLELIE